MQQRSLRFNLTSAFVFLVAGTSLLLGAAFYTVLQSRMSSDLSTRLGGLTAAAALLVDPDEHANLQTPADMAGAEYQRYRALFAAFRAGNPDVQFLYTLRLNGDGTVVFVLDSGTSSEDYSPLGMVYEDPDPGIIAALEQDRGVQVATDFYTDQWGTWLSATAPIGSRSGKPEAVIGLDISAASIQKGQAQVLGLSGVVALATACLGMVVGLIISRRIARPLLAIAADMDSIRHFELNETLLPPSRIAEVTVMEEALDSMKKGLRSFRKYVPADVVGQLITLQREAVLETSAQPVTVFFSDIENFTGIAESIGATRIAEVLGYYFEAMTSTLHKHHATVDKYIGDAVMAFWNAPLPQSDHALRACQAAVACQQAVQALAPVWQRMGIPVLRTRIGIHSGEAVVGNIGYSERLSYTALGDTVNLASRLESLNKHYGTSLLVSQDVWQQLGGLIPGRMVDKVMVKGRSQAGGIYELLGSTPVWGGLWHEAMELYLEGKFREAGTMLDHLASLIPDDVPRQMLRERCARFLDHPPEHWDGVTVMHEK